MLGKRAGDAELAADTPTFNFNVGQAPDGVPLVRVNYLGEERAFRPEQLLAALLSELKAIGEKDQGAKITDTVLSIPGFFTEQQRRAVLDAASIAGLNVLRLIHETTATALAYGIYKTDLPADKPQHVVFLDAGHSSLQVRRQPGTRPAGARVSAAHASACCVRPAHALPPASRQAAVVAFTKSGLKVLGYGFDRNFGGRNFDEVRGGQTALSGSARTHSARRCAAAAPAAPAAPSWLSPLLRRTSLRHRAPRAPWCRLAPRGRRLPPRALYAHLQRTSR
jgi:heat shock protein 4